MWIVSGVTAVGKSYFIENKKDRLTEIINIPSFDDSVGLDIFKDGDWEKVKKTNSEKFDVSEYYDVHGALMAMHVSSKKSSELKTVKNVIILGVPYYEYKIRVKLREEYLVSEAHIVYLYRRWVDDLNKKGIPHIFVESFGDYKILEESDFFRMLVGK